MFEVAKFACSQFHCQRYKDSDGNIKMLVTPLKGLYSRLNDMGVNYNSILDIRENLPVYDRLSFNADRKMMSTVWLGKQ